MKILLAADGSKFTKKALAWLMANDGLFRENGELIVVHVQAALPPRVRGAVGAEIVRDYYAEESAKVLSPVERFLRRHDMAFRTLTQVGEPAQEILRAAAQQKAQLIVMGTHGRGMLGRAIMGSVAQKVLADATVPILLVK